MSLANDLKSGCECR